MVSDLAQHEYLQALSGGELKIDAKTWHLHKNMKVNGANIIKPDLIVDNGVCHAIDKVLMPKTGMIGRKNVNSEPVISTGTNFFIKNEYSYFVKGLVQLCFVPNLLESQLLTFLLRSCGWVFWVAFLKLSLNCLQVEFKVFRFV